MTAGGAIAQWVMVGGSESTFAIVEQIVRQAGKHSPVIRCARPLDLLSWRDVSDSPCFVVDADDLDHRTEDLARRFAACRASLVVVSSLNTPSVRVIRTMARAGVKVEVIVRKIDPLPESLHCIIRRGRVLGSLSYLMSTLLPPELGKTHSTVAATILGSCRPQSAQGLSVAQCISEATLRSRFAAAGWPPPGHTLKWLLSLHSLWVCCEHGSTLAHMARGWGELNGDRLAKRIRKTTRRSLREWQRGDGFRAAADDMRARMAVGDF